MSRQKTLKTRIILRNDSSASWIENKDQILLKGEVGIEFFTNNKVKIKIGDGIQTWETLPYFGGENTHIFEITATQNEKDIEKIIEKVGTTIPFSGDIAIIKRLIANDKYSYTAYVYNGSTWAAMNGNYNASNIYFDTNLLTTSAIGNIALNNGQAEVNVAGKNLLEAWETIFVKEDTDIAVTEPSASISASSPKYLEIGQSATQEVTLNFDDGNYEYGYTTEENSEEGHSASSTTNNGSTGSTANKYTLMYNGQSIKASSATNKFSVASGTKNTNAIMSASGSIGYTQGYIPVSNLKKMYASKRIKASSVEAPSKTLFYWYIPMYAGFKYPEGVIASPAKITNSEVKGLTAITGSTAYDKIVPTSANATKAWRQYFIAVPAEYKEKKPSVLDSNNLPLTVEVANDVTIRFGETDVIYNVWFISLADNYDTTKIFIKW